MFATYPGEHDVALSELVSPLRYDIVVRAEFLDWYEKHRDLYAADFPEFRRRAFAHPYGTCFRHVALARFHSELLANEADLERAFEGRLHRTARLWEAYREHGFDPRFPIVLRIPGRRTIYGPKMVRRSYYIGDGCHRLALLLIDGQKQLPRSWHRVDRIPLARVLDNTSLILPHLEVGDREYYSFVSRGYIESEASDAEELVAGVELRVPERRDELLRVLSVDRPLRAGSCRNGSSSREATAEAPTARDSAT